VQSFRAFIGHFYSCKDVSRIVSEMQERDLSLPERWKLRWHLAVCEACVRFEEQMRFLRAAIRRYRQ
jgi:hypothetical protein